MTTSLGVEAPANPEGLPVAHEKLLNPSYRNYVLLMGFIGLALNLLDRQILGVVAPHIKAELHLSDSSLGLLLGLAFASFYVTVGLPIAFFIDTRSRRVILSIAITFWSLMTVLCGFAQNFVQLLLARMGVGAGEAGFTPANMSLLADYFPKSQRTMAFAVANLGPMLGITLGYLVGGFMAPVLGWRGTLMLVGAPGLVFGLIFFLTVREPPRGLADGVIAEPPPRPSFLSGLPYLWKIRTFRYLTAAKALSTFGQAGLSAWMPSYLGRSYHLPSPTIGLILGPIVGLLGGVGILFGGYVANRWSQTDARGQMWFPAISTVVAIPLLIMAYTVTPLVPMMVLYAIGYLFSMMYLAPSLSLIHSLVPLNMRATGTAWMLFFSQLVGIGLGPQLIGMLSDRLNPVFHAEALRHALGITAFIYFLPAICYVLAARHYRADVAFNEQRGLAPVGAA